MHRSPSSAARVHVLAAIAIAATGCGGSPPPPETPAPRPSATTAPAPEPSTSAQAPKAPEPWPTFQRDEVPPTSVSTPDGSIANVDTVVAGMGRHLNRCYDRELQDNPAAQGAVRLRVQIGAKGTVDEIGIMSKEGNLSAALLRCVAMVIRSRWFAKPPGGGARLELPLRLAPNPKPSP